MKENISTIRRTFPKKTTAISNNLNSRKRMQKKGYQKNFQSIFNESSDDCDNNEAEVNLKQQFNNKKTKKAKKQKVFIEKNAANQSKELLLSKECNSDFSAENDGLVTWNSNDDQSNSKKRSCNFNRKRSNGQKEQLSSVSNERKNNVDLNNVKKSEMEMKYVKLSPTNYIKQEETGELDRYSSDEKEAEFTEKPIQNMTISPTKKHDEDFDSEGFREIAVFSPDKNIDPVGACIGVKGERIKTIIHELNGEKIDVIHYSSDLGQFVIKAVIPAGVSKVIIDENENCVKLIVPNSQLSLAIRKKDQNVRLASSLLDGKIAKIPLGKTKQLQERLGTKLFDKAFFVHDSSSNPNEKPTQKVFVRENPKRPREVSSKMPVSKFRNIFANEKLKRPVLDPRFDSRCGEFNDYIYHKNYSFLDEIRQREKKILVKELKNMTEEGNIDKNRLKEALRKIKNQEKTQADVNRRKEIIREIRHENNERMRQGLPPIFKTRAQIRELLWRKKYDELKGGKKLEKYLRRKIKKQDRRHDINKSVSHENEIASDTSD